MVCVVLVVYLVMRLCAPHPNAQAKELPTYKDNDFINDGQKIHIDDENKKMFMEKLRKDVEVGTPHGRRWPRGSLWLSRGFLLLAQRKWNVLG